MDEGLGAAEDPMVGVASLDANARLVRADHLGLAQLGHGLLTPGHEAVLSAAQHVHQHALADADAKDVCEGRLEPLIREALEGLQVGRQAVQARSERAAARRLRHGGQNAGVASRTTHCQTLRA